MVILRSKIRTRLWALFCAVIVTLVLVRSAPAVSAVGTGRVSGSSVSAEKGGNVTVTFSLAENPGIWGMKGAISYDASVLTLKSVAVGTVFSESEIMMGEDLSQNPFIFLANGSTIADKTQNGALIKLTFSVSANAELDDYAVNISISQAINADGQDISINTSAAKVTVVKCLHNTTYLKNAVKATEEKEGYTGDTYCKKCETLLKKGTSIPKVVNTCKHSNELRTVITEATCETGGKAKITCKDCGKNLSEEDIPATGHTEGAPKDWKSATTTEEGYTGDVYCEVCDKLLLQGTVIPKIKIVVYNMTTQTQDTYTRDSQTGLVFVSSADMDTFVRVEIDGIILDTQNYTVESGSTKVTLKPEYLEKLNDGKHTVTIVSDAGTASAQFYVAPVQENPSETPDDSQIARMRTIAIIAVLVALGCIAFTTIVEIKRNRKGRYSHYAK